MKTFMGAIALLLAAPVAAQTAPAADPHAGHAQYQGMNHSQHGQGKHDCKDCCEKMKGKDGKIYIGVANMNPDDGVNLDIALGGLAATRVSGEVMTADRMNAMNDFGVEPVVKPVAYTGGRIANGRLALAVPAKSVVVVRLD